MATYSLPHFGDIDPKDLEEYYDVDIVINGLEVAIDLNFDENQIDTKRLDILKKFMEDIPALDKKNKKYIEQDYADENADTVRTYVEHHLEELGKEELSGLVDDKPGASSPAAQLMNLLRLVRVGFYPENKDGFATFDYSIGEELTQYLVVININENGGLCDIAMES